MINEIELHEGRYLQCKCGAEMFCYFLNGEATPILCPHCQTWYMAKQIDHCLPVAFFFTCDECGKDDYIIPEYEDNNNVEYFFLPDLVECAWCNTTYEINMLGGKEVSSQSN